MPPLCHVSHIWHSCVSVSQYPNPVIVACRLHRALRWPGHLLPLNRCEGFDPPAAPSSYLIPSLCHCTRYCCYLDLSQQFPWTDLPSFVFGKCSSCVLSSAVVSVLIIVYFHTGDGVLCIFKNACALPLLFCCIVIQMRFFKKNVQSLLGASKSEHFTGVYPCSTARMWRSERATPLKGNIEEMCERREARMRFSERIDTI